MTQEEAIAVLEKLLGRALQPDGYPARCTGDASTCPIDECMLCSVRDCPGDEPLHYHHDGCPHCFSFNVEFNANWTLKEKLAPVRGELVRRAKAERACWPKEMHSTRGAAEAQMRSITRRGLAKDAARIHVYRCPYCHAWHVGHTIRRGGKA